MKKTYKTPELNVTTLELGVFGSYGHDDDDGGCGGGRRHHGGGHGRWGWWFW